MLSGQQSLPEGLVPKLRRAQSSLEQLVASISPFIRHRLISDKVFEESSGLGVRCLLERLLSDVGLRLCVLGGALLRLPHRIGLGRGREVGIVSMLELLR